jgi:hypothetical protein
MIDKTTDDFFTAKHARLIRIANIANVFAWVVIAVFILAVGAKFIQVESSYYMQQNIYMNTDQNLSFANMLAGNLVYAASFYVNLISIFLQGMVFGLVLKGISLGLNMIVETDLNYRVKAQGESHE